LNALADAIKINEEKLKIEPNQKLIKAMYNKSMLNPINKQF
jgi:hypothetical protein